MKPPQLCDEFEKALGSAEILGQGSNGTVYKVKNKAVKVFSDTKAFKEAVNGLRAFALESKCGKDSTSRICKHFMGFEDCPNNFIIEEPCGIPWLKYVRETNHQELQSLQRAIAKTMEYLLFKVNLQLPDFKADNTVIDKGTVIFIDVEDSFKFGPEGWHVQNITQTPFIGIPFSCFPSFLSTAKCQIWGSLLALQCITDYEICADLGSQNKEISDDELASVCTLYRCAILSETVIEAWRQSLMFRMNHQTAKKQQLMSILENYQTGKALLSEDSINTTRASVVSLDRDLQIITALQNIQWVSDLSKVSKDTSRRIIKTRSAYNQLGFETIDSKLVWSF